jgi:hypothetical protein
MRSPCCLSVYPPYHFCYEAYELTLLCLSTNFLVLLCDPYRAKGEWAISSSQNFLLAYLPYFNKIKVGLWDLHAVLCLCECPPPHPPINFRLSEQIFKKLGTHIMAPQPISTTYFRNPSQQSVCLYVYRPFVARQRLHKNVTAGTNIHATINNRIIVWHVSYAVCVILKKK